jgi:pimeloyl-ACP methyl ester carboxylesterase
VPGVEHRFVQAGDLRMHVAEAGPPDGEPVLLVHGWPQHWYEWREVMPGLADRFRVLAPDLRGLGWTDAPASGYLKEEMAGDIVRLLDALDVRSVYLVGHDWGGFIGFLLCLLHPGRVRRYLALNIIHPWVSFRVRNAPELLRLSYQLPIITPGVNHRVIGRPDFMPRFLKTGAAHKGAWSERDIEAFRAPLREPSRIRASARIYRSFLARELAPMLRGRYRRYRLRTPTLLLFGVRDFAIRPEVLRGYEPYADDMRVELVEDSAHFIAEERPDLVLDRALSFFGTD